jgi:predicted  nucleic acid-binding Zn-ribbon protein
VPPDPRPCLRPAAPTGTTPPTPFGSLPTAPDPPPSPRTPTPCPPAGPDTEAQRLKNSNEELRRRLLQLNGQLDAELNCRGHGARARTHRTDDERVARLRQRVEELRRETDALRRRVYHADGVCRVTELQNAVLQREQEVERLRAANRGLGNVQRNQSRRMELVSQMEAERSRIRSAHGEEMRVLKERLRALRDAREADEKAMRRLQGQINQLEDKIALAKGLKAMTPMRTLGEVEGLMAEKEAQIRTLTETVEKLQKQIEVERRRAGQHITERDVAKLRATLQSLKEQSAEREAELRRAGVEDGAAIPVAQGPSAAKDAARPRSPPLVRPKAAEAGAVDVADAADSGDGERPESDGSGGAKSSDGGSSHKSHGGDEEEDTPRADPVAPPAPPDPPAAPVVRPPSPVARNPHNPFGFARKRRNS